MEYNLVKIDQLPDGIIGENNPIMFGIGDKIYKTNASNLLNLNQGESITPRLVSLPILVTNSNLATVLNSVNITITKNEIVLVRFNTLFGNRLSLDTFLLPLGAGVYNPLGSEISFSNLIPINQQPYDEEGSDTNTVTYTVDSLTEINTAVVPFDFSDETKVYLVVLGGQLYQFTGVLGLYGSGELQITMSDLLLLANSGAGDFIEKQFYAINPITTETFTLTNDGSTTFLLQTPTFGGFNFSNANTVKLFQGKTFTLANFTDEAITLLDGFGGATIRFPDEIIIPAGVSLRFFYQRTALNELRLNLIGAVGGGGGGTTVHNELTGRDTDDAHPISAVTDLQDELDARTLNEKITLTPTAGVITLTTAHNFRNLVFDVGGVDTNVIISEALTEVSFEKQGIGLITFTTASGRTLVGMNSTTQMSTVASIGRINSVSTTDYLYINESDLAFVKKSQFRDGVVAIADFLGNPRVATVSFDVNYTDSNYNILVTMRESREYHFENITSGGFDIVLNGSSAPNFDVKWSTFRNE